MIIILLGAPGSGKGTFAEEITKKHNVPKISTGDILRQAVKDRTNLGLKAKTYMDKGELVTDDLILNIVQERLSFNDCKNGFILDGFPRTVEQAESLNEILNNNVAVAVRQLIVINLQVSQEVLINRLTGRQLCEKCGANFNSNTLPSKVSGVCDKCGGKLYQRNDDKKEVVLNRLEVYKKQTQPLLDYYTQLKLLREISGEGGIPVVSKKIFDILDLQ
ncbi:MAG: adenylate kinase [Candidatus Firestonebacteria bacterium]